MSYGECRREGCGSLLYAEGVRYSVRLEPGLQMSVAWTETSKVCCASLFNILGTEGVETNLTAFRS